MSTQSKQGTVRSRSNVKGGMHRSRLLVPLAASVFALAGCGTPKAPGSIPLHQPALDARVVLASTRVVPGATLHGTVIVTNTTDHAISQRSGCVPSYQVLLTNPRYQPTVLWPASCETSRRGPAMSFPPGQTKIAVTVPTTYDACSQSPVGGLPACVNGGALPPLPAGSYHTELVTNGELLPPCPPVRVTLFGSP